MTFIVNLNNSTGYFNLPFKATGWLVWFAFLGFNLYLLFRWRKYQRELNRFRRITQFILAVLTPLSALFFGLHLPVGNALPQPGLTTLPTSPVLMFFSTIPWVLAAGLLGPLSSGLLAGFSGIILALYADHNFFLPLIYMLSGLVFGWLMQQNYRSISFRLARVPMVLGLVMILIYPIFFIVFTLFTVGDSLAVRLDYAISLLPGVSIAFALQLLMGVIFAQAISLIAPNLWQQEQKTIASPEERNLEAGLLYRMAPLGAIFALLVIVILSIFMFNTNQQRLAVQMRNVADSAGGSIPFSLETGQNLIVQLAEDDRLLQTDNPFLVEDVLVEYLNRVPFYNQLTYLDSDQNLIAAYPRTSLNSIDLTLQEQEAIDFALRGVYFQSYSLEPEHEGEAARLTFVVAVESDTGQVGVIIGRTNLDQNPFFIPSLEILESLSEIGGVAMLVDEQGMVLYHPDSTLIGTYYLGEIDLRNPLYDIRHTSADGTREILYVQPVPGRSWAIITTMPTEVSQELTLRSTLPLSIMLILLLAIVFSVLRIAIRPVIRSIGDLAGQATQVANGELDHSLESERVDEVGQLANALEIMRLSLRARMEEVERLLQVTKGVASSLEMDAAVNPILQGALTIGASAARLVLSETAVPEFDKDTRRQYGQGESAETYKALDRQILALIKNQPEVELSNPARARLQNFGNPLPGAILAVSLIHEHVQYGVLWIAFDKAHKFTNEERRFIRSVAGQAALAASNARLYLSAQLGRTRMEAILESTLEPLLVTDHQNQLLLANPAAQKLLEKTSEELLGKPVAEIIEHETLRKILTAVDGDTTPKPIEITFPNHQVYFVTASPVIVEGKKMGRVCLLRNVTHYKELDAMKSEFVDTVNHDLRAPLTTMRGYATMLDMVGDLNEQQSRYVKKIVQGVENMSRLVNTLLDLGRIEAGVGLKLELLPITDVVRQVAEALRMEAIQKQIDYQVLMPEETMPVVQADQALLERAIQNLIDNAIKFTPPQGKVEIDLYQEGDNSIVLKVKDSGVGISPVDLPRLFERFYRGANRAAQSEQGSGLGLAIVKSIVERHNGTVSADSLLGKGSVFTITLPIRQPEK